MLLELMSLTFVGSKLESEFWIDIEPNYHTDESCWYSPCQSCNWSIYVSKVTLVMSHAHNRWQQWAQDTKSEHAKNKGNLSIKVFHDRLLKVTEIIPVYFMQTYFEIILVQDEEGKHLTPQDNHPQEYAQDAVLWEHDNLFKVEVGMTFSNLVVPVRWIARCCISRHCVKHHIV